jgi:hypothetical protein
MSMRFLLCVKSTQAPPRYVRKRKRRDDVAGRGRLRMAHKKPPSGHHAYDVHWGGFLYIMNFSKGDKCLIKPS